MMPKVIKIGQCFMELFEKIKVARFWDIVYCYYFFTPPRRSLGGESGRRFQFSLQNHWQPLEQQ